MKKNYPIDEHLQVPVNGTTLDFRIRGTNAANPVLLFLHGGPGVCDRHFILRDQAPLTDACTLVCFDQRGAGKSYTHAQARRSMDMDTVVEDARIVVEYLCGRFRKDKINLVGHSYGSFLGVQLCRRYPQRIAAYVGIGQLADGPENERISYEFALEEAKKRGDKKALADLTRIGAPRKGFYQSMDDLMVQRNYLAKFGGAIYGQSATMIRSTVLPILRSPEYSLFDVPGYSNGAYYNMRQLWQTVIGCNFIENVRELDVPVYITQGRHDRNTPRSLQRNGSTVWKRRTRSGSGSKTARILPFAKSRSAGTRSSAKRCFPENTVNSITGDVF